MRASFLIPGNLERKTGGYGYDRRVILEAMAQGVTFAPVALPARFPFPNETDRAETVRILKAIVNDAPVLIDGLAFGAFDDAMLDVMPDRVVALVHHPLAYENGLAPDVAQRLKVSERAALACADAVIVTSAATRDILVDDYAVPADKIAVALPGTDEAAFAHGSGEDAPVLIGVGSLTPRKGWSVLIEALASLTHQNWRLIIAGDGPERDALQSHVASRGLSQRVTFLGEIDDTALAGLYDRADLFILPSLYEGFGMVLTEAVARGLPCIATDGVVATQHLPHGAVRVVAANNSADLSAAIHNLLDDEERNALAAQARAAAADLQRWTQTAKIIIETLRSVA